MDYMSKDSDKKEVEELIEILAAYYPGAKQAIHVLLDIQRWAKQLDYPINSFADFDKRLQRKPIKIGDRHVDLNDITGPIPSYYFPVASYENLIEKINELYEIKARQMPATSPQHFPAAGPTTMLSKRLPSCRDILEIID
jgi:hypothetical protein